jgi:hypothetical protein
MSSTASEGIGGLVEIIVKDVDGGELLAPPGLGSKPPINGFDLQYDVRGAIR